jgi:hypothetical protein
MGKWVGQLADVGIGLWDWIRAHRAAVPEAKQTLDLDLAWVLVGRAMSWAWALRARLNAEAKAAKAALPAGPREPEPQEAPAPQERPERPERPWDPNLLRRSAVALMARPNACIDGKSAVEVVAQICADLDAAAALLGNRSVAPAVAAIAAAARALLGVPSATWKALPVVRWADRAVEETAVMPTAARPLRAPDSG